MSNHFSDPEAMELANKPLKFKFNAIGGLAATIRLALDIAKGSVSAGTLVEIVKAAKISQPKEREAFQLVATALVKATQKPDSVPDQSGGY